MAAAWVAAGGVPYLACLQHVLHVNAGELAGDLGQADVEVDADAFVGAGIHDHIRGDAAWPTRVRGMRTSARHSSARHADACTRRCTRRRGVT